MGNCGVKSGEEAFSWLIAHHNSYSRMETLLSAKEFMQWRVFYKALGLIWTISDNIYNHKLVLHDRLYFVNNVIIRTLFAEEEL